MMMNDEWPAGFLPLGIFLFFAASMASLATITLGWPGTFLDRAWELNKTGHAQLAPLGRIMAVPFGIFGEFWKGVAGVVLVGLLLSYMTRPRLRTFFSGTGTPAREEPAV